MQQPKAWPGFETTHHHTAPQAPPVWRAPEGPEGQGGPRDRPLRAQLACGDLAGGPPPTGTLSGQAHRTGSTAGGPSGARNTSGATRPPGYAKGAGTEVPAPCRLTQPLPRRGLWPDDRQSLRRRRIHRNMPPTTAAPRPAPPIRPSKPVRARPFFGLVAGTSGAT